MSFTRDMQIRLAPAAARTATEPGKDLEIEMAFASQEPYERWWGIEILDCAPESVRLGRLNDGGALLYNHDWDALRGHHMPGTVRADADRVIRGRVSVSWAADDGKTIRLIEGGHLTKTSTGYEIHRVIEAATAKSGEQIKRTIDGRVFGRVLERCQRDGRGDLAAFRRALDAQAGAFERADDKPATYRVIDWEPLENSLVTVPADATVGAGRSAQADALAPDNTTTENTPSKDTKDMSEAQAAAPAAPAATAEPKIDVAAIERAATDKAQARINEINAIGEQLKDFGVAEMARAAIASGMPVIEFQKHVNKHLSERGSKWAPEIGMSQGEAKRFSVVKAVRAMMSGDWSNAGLEREASKAFAERAEKAGIQRQAENSFFLPVEVQRRDMTVASATGGGNMVATDLRPQDFIGLLRARTLVRELGARYLTGLVGNADITKQTGSGTAYWLASESTAITESNQTVGLLQLRPKVVGAYTEVSRLLLQQSTPDADMFVMDDLAAVLGNAIDIAAINTGGSGAPVGILGTAGIGSVTGTTLGYAGVLEFQTDVAAANALNTSCAYLTTPTVAALLAQRQRFTSTDSPLWQGNILDGEVVGFRGATSTAMPAATMVFGDFSQVVVAEWGALEIAANPYANFPAGITGIRAFMTTDVGVRVAGAFSAASAIT